MSSAAKYLVSHNDTGKAKKLPDNRLQVVRKWDVPGIEYARATEVESYLFQAWGTPDGDATGIAAGFTQTPNAIDVYPDSLLVDQYFEEKADGPESDATTVLVKVYETLTPAVLTPAGKAVTRETENGLLQHIEYFITPLDYDTDLFKEVGDTRGTLAEDLIRGKEMFLSGIEENDNHYSKVVEMRWSEAGILSVNTDRVSPKQQVTVQSVGLEWADISTLISEVTNNHRLVSDSVGNYEGFQTHNYTFELDGYIETSYGENGLHVIEVVEFSETAYPDKGEAGAFVVGTSDYENDYLDPDDLEVDVPSVHFLSKLEINNTSPLKSRKSTWVEAGILSVNTDRVSPKQQVTVQSVGLEWADISTLISEVTNNHRLVSDSVGNYEGFQTHNYTFELDGYIETSYGENGLHVIEVVEFSETAYPDKGEAGAFVVGTSDYENDYLDPDDLEVDVPSVHFLSKLEINNTSPLKES